MAVPTLDPQPNAIDLPFIKPQWPFPLPNTMRVFANQNTQTLEVEDSTGVIYSIAGPGGSGSFPTFGQYYFYISGGNVIAKNLKTGNLDFSGSDAAVVINSAMANYATTGAVLFFANGVYNLNSTTVDATTGVHYCIGIPATGSATEVQWFFVGETGLQPLYATLQTNGVIFNVTAAARTSAGAGNQLSGLYQLSSASWGQINNNVILLRSISVRIPDNQRGNECCIDLRCTLGTDLYDCTADLATPAGGQTGSNIIVAAANTVGIRTNDSSSDECRMVYCWVIGMESGYLVNTEHSFLLDCHSSFCKFCAKYGAGNVPPTHGSIWWHFQDIHCVNGLQVATVLGARLDLINFSTEILNSGTWARVSNATESVNGNCCGLVTSNCALAFVGPQNFGPFFTSGGQNFRVQCQSEKLYPTGVLTTSAISAATSGTTKQTLASFTIAAGPTGSQGTIFWNNPGAVVRVKAWGITAANGNTKTVEIDFGGTAVASISSVASGGVVELEADIMCVSNNVQECIGKARDGTLNPVLRTTPAITSNTSIALVLAATTPTQAADFTFKGWVVELLSTY